MCQAVCHLFSRLGSWYSELPACTTLFFYPRFVLLSPSLSSCGVLVKMQSWGCRAFSWMQAFTHTHTHRLFMCQREGSSEEREKRISHSNECYLLTDSGMAGYSVLKAQSCTVASKQHIRTCMNDHSKTIHNMNYAQRTSRDQRHTDVFCSGLYNINTWRSWVQQE